MAHQVRPHCVSQFVNMYANILVRHRAHTQVENKGLAKSAELERMNNLRSFGTGNPASLQSYEAYVANIVAVAKECYAKFEKERTLNENSPFHVTDDAVRILVLKEASVFQGKGGFWKALRVSNKAVAEAHFKGNEEDQLKVFLVDTLINIGAEEHADEHNLSLPEEEVSPITRLKRQREREALAKAQQEESEASIAYVDTKGNESSRTVKRTVSRDEDEDEDDGYEGDEGDDEVGNGLMTGSESEWAAGASSKASTSSTSKANVNNAKETTSKKEKKRSSDNAMLSEEESKKIKSSNKKARREQAGIAAMNSENKTAELMGSVAEQIRLENDEKYPEMRLWRMLNDRDSMPDVSAMQKKMKQLGVTKQSVGSVAKLPAAVAQLAELFKLVAGEAFKEAVNELLEKQKRATFPPFSGPSFSSYAAAAGPSSYFPYAPPHFMSIQPDSSAQQLSPQQLFLFQQLASGQMQHQNLQQNVISQHQQQQLHQHQQNLIPQQQLHQQQHNLIPQHQQQASVHPPAALSLSSQQDISQNGFEILEFLQNKDDSHDML